MTEEQEAKTYIARKPCGCLVLACYNDPLNPKGVAQSVKLAIASGYSVELVETEDVRKMSWFCEIHQRQLKVIRSGS